MPKKQLVSAEVATKIRSSAEPVIEWLRTAEEESSDDDDGVEVLCSLMNKCWKLQFQVVYSDKQKTSGGGGIVVQDEANNNENLDDIDIEAI